MNRNLPMDDLEGPVAEHQNSEIVKTESLLDQDRLLSFYRSIVANIPNSSVAVLDGELRCQLVEGQLLAQFDLKQDDLIGKVVWDVLPADQATRHVNHYLQALSGHPSTSELTYQGRTLSSHAIPIRGQGPGSDVHGIVIFTRDITEQKRVEQAHVARARQQAVVASLGQMALGRLPLDELMHEAVRSVVQTLGVEYSIILELLPGETELLLRAGVGWNDTYPIGVARVSAGMESHAGYALRSDEPVIVEDLRTETRFNGPPLLHEHHVISGISVIIEGRERPYGVMGAHTIYQRAFTQNEIDFLQSVANTVAMAIEREQVDAVLREMNEKLEAKVRERTQELERARDLFYILFHASPFPTSITRLQDGCFLEVNEAFLRYFSWEREQVIGRTVFELNLWSGLEEREQLLSEIHERGRLRNAEKRFRLPSGELRNVLVSFEITEFKGEPCLIGSLIDITERVEAERRVRHLASELTLAEQRERRRIALFLHDEFQQLLVALQLNLHLLRQKAGAEMSEQLETVGAQVNDIIEMTRNLAVEFSAPAFRSEDLGRGFAWLAGLMRERYELEVDLEVQDALHISNQDFRELLFKTVRELLFNIVKHADVKRAKVTVNSDHDSLIISVKDDGKGFDVENVMGKDIITTSFGLYTIRERLELFGGRLALESAPGAGTCATIVIPTEIEYL